MPNKKSPLQEVQREGDTLKRDVDKFVDECQRFIDGTTVANSDKKLKALQKRCQEYDKKITSLSQKASKLDRVSEPSSTSKFEEKKQQEIKRLETLKVQLDRISSKLEPDEIEEEYLREMSQELDDNSPIHEGEQDGKQSKVEDGSDLSDGDEIENDEYEEDEDDDEGGESDTQETKKSKEDEAERKEDSKTPPNKSGEGRFSRLSLFRRSSKKKEVPPVIDEESGDTDSKKNKKEKKGKEKTEKEKKEPEKKEKQDKKLKGEGKATKKEKSSGKEKKTSSKTKDSIEVDDASEEEEIQESVEKEKPEKETKTGWRLFGKQDRKMKQENAGSTSKKKEEKKNGKGTKVEEEKSSKRKATDIQRKKTDVKKGKIVEEDEDEDEDEDEYEDEEDEYEDEEDYEDEEVDEEEMTEEDEEEYEEESEEGEEEELEEEEEEEEEEESEFEEELGGKPTENEEDEDTHTFEQGMDLFEAVCDYNAEQDGDLSFKVGDILTIINTREDGWWTAEDEEGNKGLVPSTYLKMKKEPGDHLDIQSPEDAPESEMSRSGKVLWKGLRKAVRETSATDVLSAMGAIPSGFRPSTTAKLLKEDQYSLQYCLTPKLSKSNLFFKDLFWDPAANEIRARSVKMQKVIILTSVRNIPKVGVGIEVKSRHVRLCLFNGEKVLSNIHTVQATWTEVDDKFWRFSPKVTGVLPSILDGDCFLRTNSTDENLGLLIELCLYYVRTKTGEKGEFSCGWVNLPLFDPITGAPILNKNYELDVKGGTPYEQDVEVDPSISRKASTSKFRSMLSVNKQPRLSLKLIGPTKEQKTSMECINCYLCSHP